MKLRETMIAWTPDYLGQPSMAVGPHPDVTGWSAAFANTHGACHADWRDLTDDGRLSRLFALFVTMTTEGGIPPMEAHRALLAIDEYQMAIDEYRVAAAHPRAAP